MGPVEYEQSVADFLFQSGYKVRTTPRSNDYGVDVFAEKESEQIAIQVKLYGKSRKINRQMVMELHGAKDYFDCNKAMIFTDGNVLKDALEVADKLQIKIVHYVASPVKIKHQPLSTSKADFEFVWREYIMPLEGTTLSLKNGDTNEILKIDWTGISRITSTGRPSRITIKIFQWAINKILTDGFITRDEINQNYVKRGSSFVTAILANVPIFEVTQKPYGIRRKKESHN